ncbi:uncharacterized protein WCC33_000651 [Rhinophrynus dorsalis]
MGIPFSFVLLTLLIRTGSPQVVVKVEGVVYAELGSNATLYCRAETKEKFVQITWRRKSPHIEDFLTYIPGEEPNYLTPFGRRVIFQGNRDLDGSIVIQNVTLNDEGIYLCIFTTFPSVTKEGEIKLQIVVHPEVIVHLVPVLSDTAYHIVAECVAYAAKPAANITWDTGGINYTSNEITAQHDNGTITTTSQLWMVPSINLTGQEAACIVFQPNQRSPLQSNFTIRNIHYAPQVVYIRVHTDPVGSSRLECQATAIPPVSYTWKRDNDSLPAGLIEVTSGNLSFSSADSRINGLYVCEASNIIGMNSESVYIYTYTGSCYGVSLIAVLVVLIIIQSILVFYFYWRQRQQRQLTDYQGSSLCGLELKDIFSEATGVKSTLLPLVPGKKPPVKRNLLFRSFQAEALPTTQVVPQALRSSSKPKQQWSLKQSSTKPEGSKPSSVKEEEFEVLCTKQEMKAPIPSTAAHPEGAEFEVLCTKQEMKAPIPSTAAHPEGTEFEVLCTKQEMKAPIPSTAAHPKEGAEFEVLCTGQEMEAPIPSTAAHPKEGPFRVLRRINPVSYALDLPRNMRIHNIFRVSLLKLLVCKHYSSTPVVPGPVRIQNQDEYEFQSILESRKVWGAYNILSIGKVMSRGAFLGK